MRAVRRKNLRLSGIDVLLPALVSIDGRRPDDAQEVQIAVSFAEGHVQSIVAALVAHWLEHTFHRRFVEDPRGAENNLATAAFYDKLASGFADESALAAALVFPRRRSMPRGADPVSSNSAPGARRTARGSAFSRFVNGTELAKWAFHGRVRAHVDPAAGTVQVAFDELPGSVTFISEPKSPTLASRSLARCHEVSAWYGFGTPIRRPDAAIETLRDAVAARSRRAKAPAAHHG
jgi:hypothetical protein